MGGTYHRAIEALKRKLQAVLYVLTISMACAGLRGRELPHAIKASKRKLQVLDNSSGYDDNPELSSWPHVFTYQSLAPMC